MTRRMQRNPHSIEPDRFAIGNRLDRGVLTQSRQEKLLAGLGGQIALRSPLGMVGVGVRDNGAVNRSPRVYMEVAGRTVEAIFRDPQHKVQFTAWLDFGPAGRRACPTPGKFSLNLRRCSCAGVSGLVESNQASL